MASKCLGVGCGNLSLPPQTIKQGNPSLEHGKHETTQDVQMETMKTLQNYKAKKHSVLEFQVIWDHTIRDYIPNTKKFEYTHSGIGLQLN